MMLAYFIFSPLSLSLVCLVESVSPDDEHPVFSFKIIAAVAGVGVLLIAITVSALCYVATEKHKMRKREMR